MRRWNILATGACAAFLAACGPAVSETPMPNPSSTPSGQAGPQIRDEALGFWAFRPADGGPACLISLNRLPVEGGFGVHVERCEAKGLSSAARWRADGEAIVIEAANGVALARFRFVDANSWTGEDAEGVAWRMEPSPLA